VRARHGATASGARDALLAVRRRLGPKRTSGLGSPGMGSRSVAESAAKYSGEISVVAKAAVVKAISLIGRLMFIVAPRCRRHAAWSSRTELMKCVQVVPRTVKNF
jgi:hypothetical protein